MNKTFVICAVVLLAILASAQAIYRGANVKDRTLIPWYAQIETKLSSGDELLCGGSLLTLYSFMTTCGCLGDKIPANTVAYVGHLNYKLGKIATTKLICSPDYKKDTNEYNLGVAIAAIKMTESPTIKAITLPTGGNAYSEIDANMYGLGMRGVSGDYSDVIQVAKSKTRWNSLTRIETYGSTLARPTDLVVEKSLSDAIGAMCDGDEGGALMVGDTNTQIGVWKATSKAGECEVQPGTDETTVFYCIFERVTKHINWLRNVTAANVVA